MFYTFAQNNTGGMWAKEMPHYVIVEATSREEACQIASNNGVNFDDHGCPTCGPRWDPYPKEFERPSIWKYEDIDIKKCEYKKEYTPWDDEHAVIIYKNGILLRIDIVT